MSTILNAIKNYNNAANLVVEHHRTTRDMTHVERQKSINEIQEQMSVMTKGVLADMMGIAVDEYV